MTSAACRRTDSAANSRTTSSARARASGLRWRRSGCHDLLDQADLAVGSGLDGTQVAGLDAVAGHLGNGARDDQRVAVEVSAAGLRRDQPELLELGEGLLVDACSVDQLGARQAQLDTVTRERARRG